jgi:hypothetical protein
MSLKEAENYRRTYPRRLFKRTVGVLFKGQYFLAQAGEIGEGGLSIRTDLVLTEQEFVMVSFQIPGGNFVCLRAVVRSTQKSNNPGEEPVITHGIAFSNIEFAIKRQIRSFVSSRS